MNEGRTTTNAAVTALETRYWPKVNVRGPDDCWPWRAALTSAGYGAIRDEDGRVELAHRVALRLDGRDPTGAYALHSCDNPPCQNPAHLRVGTSTENNLDAVRRGRHVPRRKLTDAGIAEIRARAALGEPQVELAAAFGVSQATVSEVVRRLTWRQAA